ncbi:hypothetical protein G5B30_16740 [Sphingobacterium sp. SGG-5]|uniref:hypothetical protein n=1 Tax=Sphingobacterium sp. SGG-5 TaxID=2710881 RepID=UPI0013EDF449|nr:hypothetical protein [Sphingobacterium sp. SGG-5]NGM63558.1 hypothetical protein [Sphingobacterium sp. SGG-5]
MPHIENKKQSLAEIFSQRTGRLISSEKILIGSVISKIELFLVHYRDIIAKEEIKAIHIEYEYTDGIAEYPTMMSSTIDIDELDGLIKSLEHIWDKVISTHPRNYTEVLFTSRSGIKLGCVYRSDWYFYMKVSESDDRSIVSMRIDCLYTLLELLTKAQEM